MSRIKTIVDNALAIAADTGSTIEISTSPNTAVDGADVVYTDTWISMGQDEEADKRRADFNGFQVNQALVSKAKPDTMVMHCLPAHRGEENIGRSYGRAKLCGVG